MYCYKLNNSYTVYVNYAYLNDCIKASRKCKSTPKKEKKQATICSRTIPSKNTIRVGSEVCVLNVDTKEEIVFRIVYPESVDLTCKYISDQSPVGRALLGHGVGEMVSVKVPAGVVNYKITKLGN